MHKTLLFLATASLTAAPLLAQENQSTAEPVPALEAPAPTQAAEPTETPAATEAAEEMTEDAPALPVETDPAADTAAERSTELLPTTPAPATGALEPLPLIPELPEPTELPRQRGTSDLPAGEAQPPKPSVTAAAIEAQKARVRFREAKTKALRDPAIVAEWENSRRARTDFEKRESLKRYFKLLYARMEKLDGTLGEQIQQQQRRSLARLEQRRIEATEPLDPVERTDRFYEVQ